MSHNSTPLMIILVIISALFQFQCESPEIEAVAPGKGSYRTAAAKAFPGKIEAEYYDAMQGVQTESVRDAGDGMDVGYIDDNDWMDYSVNVSATDTYTLNFRIASPEGAGVFTIQDASGQILATVNPPKTGGWQTWGNVSATIKLAAGTQTLRIYCVKGGWNLNWFEGVQNNPLPSKAIPGKIEAESYDAMLGVRTEPTSDAGGGMNVGYFNTDDWMDYAINPTTAGTYKLSVRVASLMSDGKFSFRTSNGTVLAEINVPNTGGWQTWKTVSTVVRLSAGRQTLRLYTITGGWNINWFEMQAAEMAPNYREVGAGSGDLSIDGASLGIKPGETVAIVAGSYRNINLRNLTGASDNRITIRTTGPVEIVGGSLNLSNVQYTTLTGKADQDASAKNIVVRDNTYRATILSNCTKGVTLENIRYRNISDYSIFNATASQPYNGSEASIGLLDFKLLGIEWDNAGGVGLGGTFNASTNSGFCKNLEIAYCTYKNRPDAGNVFVANNVEDYDIHHNVIDNINSNNNNHNGIFLLTGNGSFYNNKCTNHEGQLLRAWTFSQGSTVQDVAIYNNIVWNSRKYSAFEVQSFSWLVGSGNSTYANAKIYSNTAGKLDVEGVGFVGVVVDVYGLQGGTAEIYNNLSYNQKNPGRNGGVYTIQNDVKITAKNNYYCSSSSQAGLADEREFKLVDSSPIIGKGVATGLVNADFYGDKRSTPPSIGAVE